jgi:serine/threonine protein phosphatase 1
MVGGTATMESYGGRAQPEWHLIPEEHWHFLEKRCVRYFETDTHLFTHATIEGSYPLADQKDSWLFWRRFDDAHAHFSGKTLICGHTAQKSGLPAMRPGMDVSKEEFIQANQRGERRRLSFADVAALRASA